MEGLAIKRIGGNGLARRLAFQVLETIARCQQRARGRVELVIGTAEPLDQARGPFRGAHLDHQIDIAPVDPEIERRGTHHRIEPPRRHRRLDLAALLRRKRTVMQRDGELVLIDPPQLLESELGLGAGIDEDQRQPCRLDALIDIAQRMARRMPGPGDALGRIKDLDLWPRPGRTADDRRLPLTLAGCLRCQPARQFRFVLDRRRQTNAPYLRCPARDRSQRQAQQITALLRCQGVDLVDHDMFEIGEEGGDIRRGTEQGQLFRRRQQDVGR